MKYILPKLVTLGLGAAIGLGAGYMAFKSTPKACQATFSEQLAKMEDTYKEVKPTPNAARPGDFSIEYAISTKPEFKGMVFTDKYSGKQGVIVRNQLLGSNRYYFEYADLEKIVGTPTAKLEVQPELKPYDKK